MLFIQISLVITLVIAQQMRNSNFFWLLLVMKQQMLNHHFFGLELGKEQQMPSTILWWWSW
jgi:hypothetical protein